MKDMIKSMTPITHPETMEPPTEPETPCLMRQTNAPT